MNPKMTSRPSEEVSSPVATGFWSYQPTQIYSDTLQSQRQPQAVEAPMDTFVPDVISSLPAHGNYIPTLYTGNIKITGGTSFAQPSPSYIRENNQSTQQRIVLPFPKMMESNYYKPPHQFQQSYGSSKYGYSDSGNGEQYQSQHSLQYPEAPSYGTYVGTNTSSSLLESSTISSPKGSTDDCFKLRRPSSFSQPLKLHEPIPTYFPVYASIPFFSGEKGSNINHVMVPCPVVPAGPISLFHSYPTYQHPEQAKSENTKSNSPNSNNHQQKLSTKNDVNISNNSYNNCNMIESSTSVYANVNQIQAFQPNGVDVKNRQKDDPYTSVSVSSGNMCTYDCMPNAITNIQQCNVIPLLNKESQLQYVSMKEILLQICLTISVDVEMGKNIRFGIVCSIQA